MNNRTVAVNWLGLPVLVRHVVLAGSALLPTTTCAQVDVAAQALQPWRIDPYVTFGVLATDNVLAARAGQERSDVVLQLSPRLAVRRLGPRFAVDGEVGADLERYAHSSELNRASPYLRGALRAELIDRLFFVDASAAALRVQSDPFAARATETDGDNRRLATTFRIAPHVDREVGPYALHARASYESSHVDANDSAAVASPAQTLRNVRGSASFERKPQPLGVVAELTSSRSDNSIESRPLLKATAGRIGLNYALTGESLVRVVAGRERSQFGELDVTDSIFGLGLRWSPGPRTDLRADVERRYFGTGGRIEFRHRMPWLSTSLNARREPVSNAFATTLPGDGTMTLQQSIDAVLTTRYPDAAERARVVQDVLTSRGLSPASTGAVSLASRYAQLEQRLSLDLVLLGRRNAFTLSGYAQRVTRLTHGDDALANLGALDADTRQRGVSGGINHRLTPRLALDFRVSSFRTEGLAERSGEATEQVDYRLAFTRSLGPRTSASFGVIARSVDSNVPTVPSANVHIGFATLLHHF